MVSGSLQVAKARLFNLEVVVPHEKWQSKALSTSADRYRAQPCRVPQSIVATLTVNYPIIHLKQYMRQVHTHLFHVSLLGNPFDHLPSDYNRLLSFLVVALFTSHS